MRQILIQLTSFCDLNYLNILFFIWQKQWLSPNYRILLYYRCDTKHASKIFRRKVFFGTGNRIFENSAIFYFFG